MHDDPLPIHLAGFVRLRMCAQCWQSVVKVEYRLDISFATNENHAEVYGTHGFKKSQFSLFVSIGFIHRLVLVRKLSGTQNI